MKKLLSIFMILIVGSFAVSCKTGNPNDVTANDKYDDTKQEEVIFWHNMGNEGSAVVDKFIEEFQVKYPKISVTQVTKSGTYDDLKKAVSTSIAAGNNPDLTYCYPDHVAAYLKSGKIQDLGELINSKDPVIAMTKESQEDFLEGAWDEGKVYADKKMHSLAYSKSTEALFYNKTFFDAHGLEMPNEPTWDAIWDLSDKIKKIPGYENKVPFGYDSSDNLYITASEQLNIDYTTSSGNINFNNAQARAMVDYFYDQIKLGRFTTRGITGAYSSDYYKLPDNARDAKNDIMMLVGSTGGAKYNYRDTLPFEVGVVRAPYFDKVPDKIKAAGVTAKPNNHMIQQGPSITLFNNESANKTIASWLFLKYITDTKQTVRFALQSGYAPVRYSAFDDPDYQAFLNNATGKEKVLMDAIKLFNEYGESFFTSPAFAKSSTVRSCVGAILDKVFRGEETIKKAFDDAEEEAKL